MSLRLNLGSSDSKKPGFLSVDRCPPADVLADLSERWPWEDSTVDAIYSKDVFEHLEAEGYRGQRGQIWAMNEAHRVLRPGGMLELIVPTVSGPGAFQDPTHINYWTKNSKFYFCAERSRNPNHPCFSPDGRWVPWGEWTRFHVAYGITALFGIHSWDHVNYCEDSWKVFATLEALK